MYGCSTQAARLEACALVGFCEALVGHHLQRLSHCMKDVAARRRSLESLRRPWRACLRPGTAGRGQSLVVWAIREGRDAATAVDAYLGSHAHSNGSLAAASEGGKELVAA